MQPTNHWHVASPAAFDNWNVIRDGTTTSSVLPANFMAIIVSGLAIGA
ncbi:MAG TPA: hypothetical protein VIL86_09730 [Tepidisphaeraceae bacterium]